MANAVTYEGPKDPRDPSVAYEIDGYRFRLGEKVEDVPDKVAKQLKADGDHKFTVTKPDTGGTR